VADKTRRCLERPEDGPEGVRCKAPNNACPCMIRGIIKHAKSLGELAEWLTRSEGILNVRRTAPKG